MGKRENSYQAGLKKRIEERLPGSIVMKTDSSQLQGIPDLLVLYKDRWALLEVKRSENAAHRPNQDYYVDKFNKMSFSSFIYPENEEGVLNDLEQSLSSRRSTRLPKC